MGHGRRIFLSCVMLFAACGEGLDTDKTAFSGNGFDPAKNNGGGGGGSSGPTILLYASSPTSGNLGAGRANSDAPCIAAGVSQSVPGAWFHALISYNNGDTISVMPTTFGFSAGAQVRNATGTELIANSWGEFVNGPLLVSLNAAGVVSGNFWTGASAGGGGGSTCLDWTTSSMGQNGGMGSDTAVDITAVFLSNVTCPGPLPLVCLAKLQ